MQEVSSILRRAVSQVLIVSDGVYEGAGFASLLRNANIHILLLLPSSTLIEEATRLLFEHSMRGVQVHAVSPLTYRQMKQERIVTELLN